MNNIDFDVYCYSMAVKMTVNISYSLVFTDWSELNKWVLLCNDEIWHEAGDNVKSQR